MLTLLFASCSDGFLEKRPTEFISGSDIEKTTEIDPELQDANLQGLYTLMFDMWTGGTEGHDDFGQKGYDIFLDMIDGDMVLAGYNYGWYQRIVEYTSLRDYSNNNNYTPWRYYYRIIFGANNVIDQLGGNDAELDEPEARHVMGQAKTMRAFAYFYLANMYGKGDYSMNSGQGILPLYTEVGDEGKGLSTGAEVYAQITADLEDSVDLLSDFNRSAVNEINASVAKGLLAYAYAAMNEYDKVKTLSQEVIDESGRSLLSAPQIAGPGLNDADNDYTSEGGFNSVDNYKNSLLWGTDITLDHGLDLVSWWGQIDVFTYSYAYVGDRKTINIDLFNEIPDTDIRKTQFADLFGDPEQRSPVNKFYAPKGRANLEVGEQREVTTDYFYMRIEEMYLLNAEASAKTGDFGTARQKLKDLLEIRMPDDYQQYLNGVSDGDLVDEIYFQTRVELWGEGKSYLAFKRLKESQKLGENHLTFPGEVISYDEDRVSFLIPESEVINNPNL